ncbi:choice-of-anchor A family protein [Streptomyces sp. NPDC001941]|uniref:choice-of-anchor A family protein n=1 Tax=Streptomyces sp. NPDC001941 TaxID=3154659 RepID=UPI00331F2726
MRTTAAVAALTLTGSLVLGLAPAASATTACATEPLGVAGRYAEFVEGDSTRVSDSEGAVAVGGDARFGDPATKVGFSVGSKLTADDLKALPGGHSLVVAGTLHASQVVLSHGTGVYGKLVDASAEGQFALDGKAAQGSAPFDFGREFARLRALSGKWGALKPGGTATPSGATLTLEGGDPRLNVFTVEASVLEKAAEIRVKVPAASSTVVNVTGSSYDMGTAPTHSVLLWDAERGAYVQDDYAAGSPAFKQLRSRLLWNFPQATRVQKNYTSWPGTLFAPGAEVRLGARTPGGETGPGHVNGAVVAKTLTSVSGAETHQMPFRGCLPTGTQDTPAPGPTPSRPSATPASPSPRPPAEGHPTPSGSATPSPGAPVPPREGSGAPKPPTGDLARTGSEVGPGLIGGAVAAIVAGGALVAVTLRRRRTRS